ncbi:AraC family transcriptional regulator [Paenibacillus mucilaginosus 3016]|uniref:AraC family transcriptional regulator n=1 Tax=Paenibacillus mucilaginosus 3016 TaxID=1116391 RepID=H6NJA6_9BACL|nr:AraC family transcriptional regulator [Paenibacillus mucilaginosus]AFC29185.1 AraC family transcriptional regulator [Paenibacillus mucilaginosus 3016]WFA17919.1 AraC family transcriptional regulator [Paenibacillus mucilaginosus]
MEDLHFHNDRGTFIVSHRKALSHHMPDSHFHSTYEIYYLMSGKREFFIKDRTMVIREGDLVIIAPNILHRTTNAEMPMHERFIVNMHEQDMMTAGGYNEILQPLFEKDYLIVPCSLHDRLSVDALVHGVIQEMQERKPGFEMYAQTLVLQLLITCCRLLRHNTMEPLVSPSPMHERISEIVQYINSRYMDELSLNLLADTFYVSPYYLSRFFKEATGFTFVEYVNSVRIKEAKKLLERSTLKVNLIAKKVGFGSITHFGRVFKAVTGHAPLYYRKAKEPVQPVER